MFKMILNFKGWLLENSGGKTVVFVFMTVINLVMVILVVLE